MSTGATLCLNMIVKNEARVIERCLDSVRPLVQSVLIVDTGSNDGTQDIIRRHLARHGLPGEVIDEPWRDFAYNRTFALAELRKREDIDYALIMDADDRLVLDDGFDADRFRAGMAADLFDVRIEYAGIAYYRPHICRNRLGFSFKGVLHEYLEAPPGELTRATATGFHIVASTEGARGRNPRKYQDDAALLERALATETDPFLISRYTFYLAQSYRDCGDKEMAPAALAAYLRRAELGYWDQEIFLSLLAAGKLMAELGRPFDEVIATLLRASDAVPTRAEALCYAAQYCREKGRNAEGQAFAARGLAIPKPETGLFVEPSVYDYGLLDEYALNAYWAGNYREFLDACLRLLSSDKLPAAMSARVLANARFAVDKLPKGTGPNLGTLGAENFLDQHRLAPPSPLRSRVSGSPRVLVAILAKQKAAALPLYLDCIEALDYPKSSIVLYIRTNNNTDDTERILRAWVERVGPLYAGVEFDAADVPEPVEQFGVHEWNATRFRVLGRIRNISLRRALERECDFYFVADVDNFIRPCTLRELVALDLPIAAPLLRSIAPKNFYSNFHAEIDANGYYRECDQYHWMLNRWVRGVMKVPVVHCTYLIRADVLNDLTYEDGTDRYEYVVFSHSARKSGVVQYLDNRQVYGYITFATGSEQHVDGGIEQARGLLTADLRAAGEAQNRLQTPAQIGKEPPGNGHRLKTLVFCTAFATTREQWDGRYRRWLRAIRASKLHHDAILVVDDGSPVLPDWPDAEIRTDETGDGIAAPPARLVVYHFQRHLGRRAVFDFPGWYRSFAFAGRYAHAHGFEKVIHIESDAFLIGSRVQRYFNEAQTGWTALWCPLETHRLPESALQVIAGDAVRRFAELERTHPHERLVGREFELQLPFDVVEKRFKGDRYGEYLPFIPGNAEYAVQVRSDQGADYYWWLDRDEARRTAEAGRCYP